MKRLALGLLFAVLCSAADTIAGAGATFPAPLYRKWLEAFQASHAGMAITYDAVGSGEGLKRLKAGGVDFAASDIPVTDATLVSIPAAVGAVVPIYNLPGITGELKLTSQILVGIYRGNIRRWDDPAIKAVNRKLALPGAEIVAVHRGDGSGTTFIWTSFLARSDSGWQTSVGAAGEVKWPVGIPAAGNEGVAQKVRETPYAVGYAEFIYALQNRLSYAAVRNDAGRFIQPDTETIRAAAADPLNENGYPITAVTWFVVPRNLQGEKRSRLVDFMNWMLDRGQNQAESLGFIPLSAPQLAKAHELLGALSP
jgi:phosphate transport system substrate-binding protein